MVHITKSCDKKNKFLPEGTVRAVNFGMSGLRTWLKKCLTKKHIKYINFNCDDFNMSFYFCLVNKKLLQNCFIIIHKRKFTIFCMTLLSWWKEMAFGTVFAMTLPVVKENWAKKVVSALYSAIRWKNWCWWGKKNKKHALEHVLFTKYIFEDLKT